MSNDVDHDVESHFPWWSSMSTDVDGVEASQEERGSLAGSIAIAGVKVQIRQYSLTTPPSPTHLSPPSASTSSTSSTPGGTCGNGFDIIFRHLRHRGTVVGCPRLRRLGGPGSPTER